MSATRQCTNTTRPRGLFAAYGHAMPINITRKPGFYGAEVFTQRLQENGGGSSVPISRGGPPPSSR